VVSRKVDPIEKEIEAALEPGRIIEYREARHFDDRLASVKKRIDRLIHRGGARRAIGLCEAFIAGCVEKAGEVNKSSSLRESFIEDLISTWIRARQAAETDPSETAEILLAWMDSDGYGLPSDLEATAVRSLDAKGLEAFFLLMRKRFDGELGRFRAGGGKNLLSPEARNLTRSAQRLKAICRVRLDAQGYLAVAEEVGIAVEDHEALARILREKGDFAEALSWVEGGLDLEKGAKGTLESLRIDLLIHLGRTDEAVARAWELYAKRPSRWSFRDFKEQIPRESWPGWREKAIGAMGNSPLEDAIDVYVAAEAVEPLASLVRRTEHGALEDVSHFTTEPAAKLLRRPHPDTSAKLERAMAFRILDAGKSKYYDAALENLERARKLYLKAGMDVEWDAIGVRIETAHRRKAGFLASFRQLVRGEAVRPTETFLEQAKKRFEKITRPG
jgi:tetratricopeptide (TPR) repeat protein